MKGQETAAKYSLRSVQQVKRFPGSGYLRYPPLKYRFLTRAGHKDIVHTRVLPQLSMSARSPDCRLEPLSPVEANLGKLNPVVNDDSGRLISFY
jgi:hypothetical protein